MLSHTGVLAGSATVWHTAIRQSDAIAVDSMDELLDIAMLFNTTAPSTGRNIAIVGIGGGFGVFASDHLEAAGLTAHRFPKEITDELRQLLGSEIGAGYRNPVELFGWTVLKSLPIIADVLAKCKQIDYILIHLPVGFVNSVMPGIIESAIEGLGNLSSVIKRRIIIILHAVFTIEDAAIVFKLEKLLSDKGLPFFPSIDRAANALYKFIYYNEKHAYRQ